MKKWMASNISGYSNYLDYTLLSNCKLFPFQFFHIHPPASGSCYTRPDQTLIKSRNLSLAASSNRYWGKISAPGSCTVSENPDPKVVLLHLIPLERYISTLNSLLPFQVNNENLYSYSLATTNNMNNQLVWPVFSLSSFNAYLIITNICFAF